MKSQNSLVKCFIHHETVIMKKTKAEVIREMNSEFDTKYTNSRLNEWEDVRNNRSTRLPRRIRLYMLEKCLAHILKRYNGKVIRSLCEKLT